MRINALHCRTSMLFDILSECHWLYRDCLNALEDYGDSFFAIVWQRLRLKTLHKIKFCLPEKPP